MVHRKIIYHEVVIVTVVIMENTTIQISKETKERLSGLGKHGETYNSIVNKLLDRVIEKEV